MRNGIIQNDNTTLSDERSNLISSMAQLKDITQNLFEAKNNYGPLVRILHCPAAILTFIVDTRLD